MDEMNDEINTGEINKTDSLQPLPQESHQPLMVGYFDCESACWTAKYQNSHHFQKRLAMVWQWLSRYHPGQVLLDYGCGSGILLKSLVEAGFKVTGADISEDMLASAAQTLQTVLPKDNVRLVRVNEQFEGPYADRLYDGIISLGVIEYVGDYQALLARFEAILKPGGFLIISFPNRASWLRSIEQWIFKNPNWFRLFRLFPHLTGTDSYFQFQRNQWTVREFQALLKPLNFELSRLCYQVTPALLQSFENHASLGMTAITEFIKQKY
jgi:2-polyprenyl-3-methyl-5-hydroxy-6-metoxy-1,4-benzoquinol methylase